MPRTLSKSELSACLGAEIGVSRWFAIDQSRIDAFAETTEDRQFIHLDPERAAMTPFGGTVAHGFLTLSMLSAMSYDALPKLRGQTTSVNYGFDKLRFVAPVIRRARIRGRFTLDRIEEREDRSLMLLLAVTIEIENHDRPAISALWRVLFLFE
ncbi:MAG: MaoC family dehydratase [Sulfitobacter sp.]